MSATMPAERVDTPTRDAGHATGRRSLVAVAVAALIGLAASVAVAASATLLRVRPVFSDSSQVMDTPWGSPERFGVEGSRILHYEHDTDVEMRLPWTGGPVLDARLGDEPVHLLTVTEVDQRAEELVLTLHRDNCRYFHERAIDMFAGIELTLSSGGTTEVLFDRPLFVKSPMLASCPDRTVNRQDHVRAEFNG